MAEFRVALVDDHPLFRNALAQVLHAGTGAHDFEIVEFGSLDDLIARLDAGAVIDLLLLDLGLPGSHGLTGLISFRSAHPAIPVIVVSAQTGNSIPGRCLMLGAAGFIPKSATSHEIRSAVRSVLAGGQWVPEDLDTRVGDTHTREMLARLVSLSGREMQVFLLLGKGLLNRQIAMALGISEATVKAHVSKVLEKLQVSSRTHAVVVLQQLDGKDPESVPAPETTAFDCRTDHSDGRPRAS